MQNYFSIPQIHRDKTIEDKGEKKDDNKKMADVDIFHKSLNFEKDIVFFQ